MNEQEIEILQKGEDQNEVTVILKIFLQNNEKVFTFPNLKENNNRVILWTAIFQHLQKKTSEPIHDLCLSVLRVLSRDKEELDKLFCEKWITVLVEKSGLYNYVGLDDASPPSGEMGRKEIVLEALKCLCNSSFNSEVVRALCAHTSVAQALIGRLRLFKGMSISFKNEILLYDMKLLFILSALRADVNKKIMHELNGMEHLINGLNQLLSEAYEEQLDNKCNENSETKSKYMLQDHQQAIVCEILKIQFNLLASSQNHEHEENDAEEPIYLKLTAVLKVLLSVHASSENLIMDLLSNVSNLLTRLPLKYFQYLTPHLGVDDRSLFVYDNRDMEGLQSLVKFLQNRLIKSTNLSTEQQLEQLSPILTVMLKSARSCREHRKYLRQVVLPPLRDVSSPPEKGDALRNMLCKLLTTPITSVRDLVAEFMFVLCKEKVGRFVKYTGFGNAAGHLAQKGLLGGGRGAAYSSSSDDSDTEEYLEAQPHIDPVVGCTRQPRVNPFEGMTEEQKEYEAMKLVNLFDKMVSEGVVKPAVIGPDGRPQPVEHVLELRESAPNRPQS